MTLVKFMGNSVDTSGNVAMGSKEQTPAFADSNGFHPVVLRVFVTYSENRLWFAMCFVATG